MRCQMLIGSARTMRSSDTHQLARNLKIASGSILESLETKTFSRDLASSEQEVRFLHHCCLKEVVVIRIMTSQLDPCNRDPFRDCLKLGEKHRPASLTDIAVKFAMEMRFWSSARVSSENSNTQFAKRNVSISFQGCASTIDRSFVSTIRR